MKKTSILLALSLMLILNLSMIHALDTSLETAGATTSYPTVGPACVEILQGTMFKQADEATFDKVIFVPKEVRIIEQDACNALRGKDFSNIAPIIPAYSLDKLVAPVPENVPTTVTSKILLSYNDFFDGIAKNTEKINAKAKATIDPAILNNLKSLDTSNQKIISLAHPPQLLFISNKLAFPDPMHVKSVGEVYLSTIPKAAGDTSSYSQIKFTSLILKSDASINFTSFRIKPGNQDVRISLDYVIYKAQQQITLQSDKKVDFYLNNVNGPKGITQSEELKKVYLPFKQVKEIFLETNDNELTHINIVTDGLDTKKATDTYYYLPNRFAIFPNEKGEVDVFSYYSQEESSITCLQKPCETKGFVVFVPKKVVFKDFKEIKTKGNEITGVSLNKNGIMYYGYPNNLNAIKNLNQEPLELGFGTSEKLLQFKNDWILMLTGKKAEEKDLVFEFNKFQITLEKGVTSQNAVLSLVPATETDLIGWDVQVPTANIMGNAAYRYPVSSGSEKEKITLLSPGLLKPKKQFGYAVYILFDEEALIKSLIQASEKFEIIQMEREASFLERSQTTKTPSAIALKVPPAVEIPASASPEPKIEAIKTEVKTGEKTEEIKIVKAATASVPDPCKTSFPGYKCMAPTGKDIMEPLVSDNKYKYECKIEKVCKDSEGKASWCCPSGGFETRCCKKTELKLPSPGARVQLPLQSITESIKEQIAERKKEYPDFSNPGIFTNLKMDYPQADASSTSVKKPALPKSYIYLDSFEANGKTYHKVQAQDGKILTVGEKENSEIDMGPALYGTIGPMPANANKIITPQKDDKVQSIIKYYKSKYGSLASISDLGIGNGPRLKVAKWEFILDEEFDKTTKQYVFPLYRPVFNGGRAKGAYIGQLVKEGNNLKIEISNLQGAAFSTTDYEILNNLKIGIPSYDADTIWRGPTPALKFGPIYYPN